MVRKAKEEYVVGLCVNGYSTIVIIKSDYLTLVNPESDENAENGKDWRDFNG